MYIIRADALLRNCSKAACLFELYLSGVSFYVLPDDFLIHQSHEYAETARKNERKYNRKLYMDFREELCFRYLNDFIGNGKLRTPASKNLLAECKKIKGFSGAAGKVCCSSLRSHTPNTAIAELEILRLLACSLLPRTSVTLTLRASIRQAGSGTHVSIFQS